MFCMQSCFLVPGIFVRIASCLIMLQKMKMSQRHCNNICLHIYRAKGADVKSDGKIKEIFECAAVAAWPVRSDIPSDGIVLSENVCTFLSTW